MSDLTSEPVHKCCRGLESEAQHVDHHVRVQRRHAVSEGARSVRSHPIHRHLSYVLPDLVLDIRRALPSAHVDHLVTGPDQAWNQKGADVSTAPHYDNPHVALR
jgi:hypothetical protein